MSKKKVKYCKMCWGELVRIPPIEGGRASAGVCANCGMCYARITNAVDKPTFVNREKQLGSVEIYMQSGELRELQRKVVDVLEKSGMDVPGVLLAKETNTVKPGISEIEVEFWESMIVDSEAIILKSTCEVKQYEKLMRQHKTTNETKLSILEEIRECNNLIEHHRHSVASAKEFLYGE